MTFCCLDDGVIRQFRRVWSILYRGQSLLYKNNLLCFVFFLILFCICMFSSEEQVWIIKCSLHSNCAYSSGSREQACVCTGQDNVPVQSRTGKREWIWNSSKFSKNDLQWSEKEKPEAAQHFIMCVLYANRISSGRGWWEWQMETGVGGGWTVVGLVGCHVRAQV